MNRIFLPFITLIASIAIVMLIVRPQYDRILLLNTQEQELDEALLKAEELTQRSNELSAKLTSISPEDLDRLDIFLPKTIDNVKLIVELDILRIGNGLVMKNITVSDVREDREDVEVNAFGFAVEEENINPYKTADIGLTIEGEYQDILDFMTDVEGSLRLVDIRSINFTSISETDLFSANLILETYWLPS